MVVPPIFPSAAGFTDPVDRRPFLGGETNWSSLSVIRNVLLFRAHGQILVDCIVVLLHYRVLVQ